MPCLLSLLLALVLTTPLYAAERMSTFDAHIHYNGDSQAACPPRAVPARLDEAGVAGALFVRHADRFLLGTDTWAVHRGDAVRATHESARRWLRELPPGVAEAIAHVDAERLFGKAEGAAGRSGGATGDGGAPHGNRERKGFGT